MKTAPEFLHKAAALLEERGKDYDQPQGERSMGKTVRAFNTVTGKDLTEAEGWLLLQILKDVRQWQKPEYHADSAEDCVSYAALKAEALACCHMTGEAIMPSDLGQQHVVEWPADEARADLIGQNGNDGEHYAELEAKRNRWEGAPEWANWYAQDRLVSSWFEHDPEWSDVNLWWVCATGRCSDIEEGKFLQLKEARP